jgi:DNA-binding MarR family transcriptional regulator
MIEVNSSTPNREKIAMAITRAVMRWQDVTQDYDDAVGKELDLNLAERRCLSFLIDGPQPAGAIAAATTLTPAAVTSLIDRMEARGYVVRTRTAEDRRKVMVATTDAARQAAGRYYGPIAEEGARFLGSFSVAELKTIQRFVEGAVALQERQLERIGERQPVEA